MRGANHGCDRPTTCNGRTSGPQAGWRRVPGTHRAQASGDRIRVGREARDARQVRAHDRTAPVQRRRGRVEPARRLAMASSTRRTRRRVAESSSSCRTTGSSTARRRAGTRTRDGSSGSAGMTSTTASERPPDDTANSHNDSIPLSFDRRALYRRVADRAPSPFRRSHPDCRFGSERTRSDIWEGRSQPPASPSSRS